MSIILGGGGALKKLNEFNLSSTSSIDFDTDLGMKGYLISINAVMSATNTLVYIQASIDGGSTYLGGGNYEFHLQECNDTSPAAYAAARSSTMARLDIGTAISNYGGLLYIPDPNNTNARKPIIGNYSGYDTGGGYTKGGAIIANVVNSNAINNIKINTALGVFASGSIIVEGVK